MRDEKEGDGGRGKAAPLKQSPIVCSDPMRTDGLAPC